MVFQGAIFQMGQRSAGVADLAHQGGAAVAQGLDPLEDALAQLPPGSGPPVGRQGGLQPFLPALLRGNVPGQGGELQMGVAVDQPRQDGAGAMVADQPLKAGQNLPGRTHGPDAIAATNTAPSRMGGGSPAIPIY